MTIIINTIYIGFGLRTQIRYTKDIDKHLNMGPDMKVYETRVALITLGSFRQHTIFELDY